MKQVGVIDYGMGNLHSVLKALQKVGAAAELVEAPEAIGKCERLVLPGVGAFGDAMDNLRRAQLIDPILRAVEDGTPLLGICLGMQVLFSESEEMGTHRGLDILKGRVRYLRVSGKVPHIGWNEIKVRASTALLANLGERPYVYFANSYVVHPQEATVIAGETDYETIFPSVVVHKNVYGVQFHPEKSQRVGLQILRNFIEQC